MGLMIDNYIHSSLCGRRTRKLFTLHSAAKGRETLHSAAKGRENSSLFTLHLPLSERSEVI